MVGRHSRFADEASDAVQVAGPLDVAEQGLLVFEDEHRAVGRPLVGRRNGGRRGRGGEHE